MQISIQDMTLQGSARQPMSAAAYVYSKVKQKQSKSLHDRTFQQGMHPPEADVVQLGCFAAGK